MPVKHILEREDVELLTELMPLDKPIGYTNMELAVSGVLVELRRSWLKKLINQKEQYKMNLEAHEAASFNLYFEHFDIALNHYTGNLVRIMIHKNDQYLANYKSTRDDTLRIDQSQVQRIG